MSFFHVFFRIPFLCFILLLACWELPAQQIITEQYIPVRGYDVREVGYPFGVIPVGGGRFAFVQYWTKSKMHPADNFYLQCLSSSDLSGLWYKQVIESGRDRFQMGNVYRLGSSIVISGRLYLPSNKTYQTIFRYFDLEGKPLHNGAIQISDWEGKGKEMEDESFHFSPNNEHVLWMGRDDDELHCSVWDEQGKKLWAETLNLSYIGKKYELKDVTITNEGHPIFLMGMEKPDFDFKDMEYPPLLVRYHPKREKFHTDTLALDSAYAIHTEMKLMNNQELVVAGAYGQEAEEGLPNGGEINKRPTIWSGFFFKKILLVNTDSLRVIADSLTPIPQDWIEHYGVEGSNYSDFKITVNQSKKGDHALLLMEEVYADKKRVFFYDVGCISFDLATGEVKWVKRINKRQRGLGGASLLSYYSDITTNKIHFVYLSERGARGKLMISSFALEDGKRRDITLASNEAATYLFFPRSSGKVANAMAVLIGMGNPGQNDYKLMTIRLE